MEDGLYLIKVPQIVYDYITKIPNTGKIGKLEVSEPNITKSQVNSYYLNKKTQNPIKITLEGNTGAKVFEMKTDSSFDTITFKENKNRALKINKLGRFIAKDEAISDLITSKIHTEEENKKFLTMIEKGKGRPNNEGIIKLSDHQFYAINDNNEKAILQKNRKDKHLKKTRKGKDELMTDIFDLFSEKNFWTIKELVDKLDQPENFLKEELNKVCNYIKSGPQKGSFELKQQYELKEKELEKEE